MRPGCILLGLLAVVVVAHGEEVCPWLTQGTAATLMGGDVSARVQVSAGEGVCEFVRASSRNNLHMTIAVSHLPPKECATGKQLTGIGQDAVLCSMNSQGLHHEIIRGHVRTTYFILSMTGKAAGASDKALSIPLEQAAEEVAGNLF